METTLACVQFEKSKQISLWIIVDWLRLEYEITGFYNTNLRHLTVFLCRALWSPWKQTSIIFDKRAKLYLRKSAYEKTCCSFWCFSYIELSVSLTYWNAYYPHLAKPKSGTPEARFSKALKAFRTRKAVAKISKLMITDLFYSHILNSWLTRDAIPF